MAVVMTTATQICRGVTGSRRRPGRAPIPRPATAGISGSTTPAIARNLQAVTTSPVSRRSVNWRIRPFECSTKRIEMPIRTRYQFGCCSAIGPVA